MNIEQMIARQSEITSLARSENRDLTPDETREFNELQTKIDAAKKDGEKSKEGTLGLTLNPILTATLPWITAARLFWTNSRRETLPSTQVVSV